MHRNSPDPQTGVSPAELVFGHPIRDHLPRSSYLPRAEWRSMAESREQAFKRRHVDRCESLNRNAVSLRPIQLGECVFIQNQTGPNPNKWSKTGQVVEILPFDSYLVKVDGSRKVTKRNRRFLRVFKPFNPTKCNSEVTEDQPQIPGKDKCQEITELAGNILDSPLRYMAIDTDYGQGC